NQRIEDQNSNHKESNQINLEKTDEVHCNQDATIKESYDQYQNDENNQETNGEAITSADLTKMDRELLENFRSKIDRIKYTLCLTCNECFPSIVLVKGEYQI
ncbi:3845_t:CDS:2, partial [Racocetra fulgida]